MVEPDFILAPQIVSVSFSLLPASNAIGSLELLNQVDRLSGLGEWVTQTAAALPPERMRMNQLVFNGLDFCIMPFGFEETSFTGFVDRLAEQNPVELRDTTYDQFARQHKEYAPPEHRIAIPPLEDLLPSRDAYISFMTALWGDYRVEESVLNEAYALLNDPPALLETMVSHFRFMWNDWLAAEWERVLPMLQESVDAYEKLNFSDMTVYEAIRAVSGRDMGGKLDHKLAGVENVIFVPSAHVGPYISHFREGSTLGITFGARLPRGAQITSSALSRSELLVRLNALADDTRLRILELMTQHDELCAQDIIEILGLSQSSVSRHLSQLSATGYLIERRREVSKCYSLNTDRVVDTLRALTNFLSRQ